MNPRLFVRLLRQGFAPLRGQRNQAGVSGLVAQVNRFAECARQARAGPGDPAEVEAERQRYLERVERGA